MNTTFIVRIHHPDVDVAHQSARACFDLLEALERDLSRYEPDSDISRINAIEQGAELLVNPHTHACLKLAMEANRMTGGLFDVTLGKQVMHRKEQRAGVPPDLHGQIEVVPDRPVVRCRREGREIDLGGIGKGYTLDQLSQVLAEFEVQSALLSSGASTHRVLGRDAWPIEMIHDRGRSEFSLREGAFSVSGIHVQGNHLVHPDASDGKQLAFKQVWLAHPEAAFADAFSTACLLMDEKELRAFAGAREEISFLQAESVGAGEIVPVVDCR